MPQADSRPSATTAPASTPSNVTSVTRRPKPPHPHANVIAMDTRKPIHASIRHASAVRVWIADQSLLMDGKDLDRLIRRGGDTKWVVQSISRRKATTLAGLLVKGRALACVRQGVPFPVDRRDGTANVLLTGILNDLMAVGGAR